MLRGLPHLFLLTLLFAAPKKACAQVTSLPDSVIAQLLTPAIVHLLDYQIAGAAFGARQVMTFEFPAGPHWSRLAAHILRTVNGRRAATSDSVTLAIGVRSIRFLGDTLVASLFEESRQLCDDGKWMHTGTDYEARTTRVFGGGWTRVQLQAGMTWDGWCLRTPLG